MENSRENKKKRFIEGKEGDVFLFSSLFGL
jgi:hypothetical protein